MVPHRMLIGYTTECLGTSKSFRSHDRDLGNPAASYGKMYSSLYKCYVVVMLYKSDIQKPQVLCLVRQQHSDIFTLLPSDLFSVCLQHILAAWTAAGALFCFGYILDEVTHLSGIQTIYFCSL